MKVRWTGGPGVLDGGVQVMPGEDYDLPENLAREWIAKGLAKAAGDEPAPRRGARSDDE